MAKTVKPSGIPSPPCVDDWVAKQGAVIVGAKVVKVVVADIGDGECAPMLLFDNGVSAFVARDSEFNGPGALHLTKAGKDVGTICVW